MGIGGLIAFGLGIFALIISFIPSLWNFFLCFIPKRDALGELSARGELSERSERSEQHDEQGELSERSERSERSEQHDEQGELSERSEQPRNYAVIVCAHNEERVIEKCVRSVLAQTHPAFECFVVADNCTDETAAKARALGATVLERTCEGPSSKGEALAFGVEHVYQLQRFDAVCILDSDTTLAPDFLTEIDACMREGFDAVTGRYLSANARESVTASLYAVYWAMAGNMYNFSHANVGLNALAQGTGFTFRTSALAAGWHTKSLTEDAEMSLQLGLAGKTIGYAANARCYAEQVSKPREAIGQLRRWRSGCISLFALYGKEVLANVTRMPSRKAIDLFALLMEYVFPEPLTLSLTFLAVAGASDTFPALCFGLIAILLVTTFIVGVMSTVQNGQAIKWPALTLLAYPFFLAFFGVVGLSTFIVPVKRWTNVKHGA